MSGTCIVCLGDLGDASLDPQGLTTPSAKSPPQASDSDPVTTASHPNFANENGNDTELIAHLKPCGHNLHNDCLTPWVERANSCPICRARFYTVELSKKVGGMNLTLFGLCTVYSSELRQAMSFPRTLSRIDLKSQNLTRQCSLKRWKKKTTQSHVKFVRKMTMRTF